MPVKGRRGNNFLRSGCAPDSFAGDRRNARRSARSQQPADAPQRGLEPVVARVPRLEGPDPAHELGPTRLEGAPGLRGEGVQGQTGYKVSGQNEQTPVAVPAPVPAAPAKVEEPKAKSTDSTTQSSTTGTVGSVRNTNPALPVAKAVRMDPNPETVKPW